MQTTGKWLGIIRDGTFLLSTVDIDPKKMDQCEREAETIAQGWRSYFQHSRISVHRLSQRDARGWKLAKD